MAGYFHQETRKSVMGPRLPFSDRLHGMKYRSEHETFRDFVNRFCSILTEGPRHYHSMRDIIGQQYFLPAGRVQAGVGSPRDVTLYNCYVSGTIADSFVDGFGSIMQRATEAAATMRKGGGDGFDYTPLRPRNALIHKLQSRSSGPVAFMEIWQAICKVTASAGNRRGAMMAVLRITHPDIYEFIMAKQPDKDVQPLWDMVARMPEGPEKQQLFTALQATLKLTGFNISVAVTDEFMEAKAANRPFDLRHGGEVYATVDPNELWERIMRSAWDWAEPGVLFIDTINRMNNLWYCEDLAASNPCGEQPLPPNGACLLGSVNLPAYVRTTPDGSRYFDFDLLGDHIPDITRSMDMIHDVASHPLPEQAQEAKNKRRMGLGVTGEANALEAILGPSYGEPAYLDLKNRINAFITHESYRASIELAQEKGPFPLLDRELYLQGEFIKALPEDIQDGIRKHGIRNSHLISYAPTGSISLAADNVSSGIEPVFSLSADRIINFEEGPELVTVEDYGFHKFGTRAKTSDRVSAQEHVDVLLASYTHVDSAVSKTCNVGPDMPWSEFKDIYQQVWEGNGKGCTTFQSGGMRAGVLKAREEQAEPDPLACYINPVTGERSCE